MKNVFFFAGCFLFSMANAQKTIDVDKSEGVVANHFYTVGGEPIVNAKFVRLTSGSPFFEEEWMKAKGVAANGTVYNGGLVKLNLLENQVHFLDPNGQEMIATSPLQAIVLMDTVRSKTFSFVHLSQAAASKKDWYQQLATGKASLYCVYEKQLHENKPYGSSLTEQSISTKAVFYLLYNDQLSVVKKPKDVAALLTDKRKELQDYLQNSNAGNTTTAEQLQAIVDYYNKLF